MKKIPLEFLLVDVTLTGLPEKRLLKSRHLGSVDLVWPRTGVAKKSAARQMVFQKGRADFSGEEWAKRILFREDIEGHCGLAVTITEAVSLEKARRFLRLTAKYALKMGADFMEKAMVGYTDIASAPIDALAQMEGTYPGPKTVAQGVLDVTEDMLPEAGKAVTVEVPLHRPKFAKTVGRAKLELRT